MRIPPYKTTVADAAYTAMRHDELTTVNGITPMTGMVIAPETYVGREGTVYPESSTPPREEVRKAHRRLNKMSRTVEKAVYMPGWM